MPVKPSSLPIAGEVIRSSGSAPDLMKVFVRAGCNCAKRSLAPFNGA
ncbi:MAG: hypothetical protein HZB39_02005 [Planctomycetes bacterium]|nr:hypothetical protein [Planctomycetota bacterium]